MRIIGNMDITGEASGAFKSYATFPLDPKVGTWALISDTLMMCASIADAPVWIPMSPEKNTKLFEQETPEIIWEVDHGLGNEQVIVQCFDENNNVIIPNEITPIDENNLKITMPEAMVGKLVVMFGYTEGESTSGISIPESGIIDGFDYYEKTDLPINATVVAWSNNLSIGVKTRLYITTDYTQVYGSDLYGSHNSGKYLDGFWVAVGYMGAYGGVNTMLYQRVS